MTKEMPESLKAWIEKESNNRYPGEFNSFKGCFIEGAISLYSHLKGLPDERDKEIEKLQEALFLIIGAYEGFTWEGGDAGRVLYRIFNYADEALKNRKTSQP